MKLRAWLQAARPLAQANIAPPLLFGQALAYASLGRFSWGAFAMAHLFGVLDQLFILFVNDWADVETDGHNRVPTPFSGGSRVVQQGKLQRGELARGSRWVLATLLTLSAGAALWRGQPELLGLTLLGVALVWGYSLAPLRLSYRGHGELLQAAGVGLVLPLFGYAIQAGSLQGLGAGAVAMGLLLGYAGNLTTALPDYSSDLADNKRSFPVRHSELAARLMSLVALCAAAAVGARALPGLDPLGRQALWWGVLACVLLNLLGVRGADAHRRGACLRFVIVNGAAISWAFLWPSLRLFTA